VFNAHGDVVQLANAAGTVTKEYNYDSFGVEIEPDENDNNPWRYCGEYFDKETWDIYLRARYYNPKTGRFKTEDPIGDGPNWYTYCVNSPIRYIDPSGLVIAFIGTEGEIEQALAELQRLTDDELVLVDGIVKISKKNENPTRPGGTELVRGIIASKKICGIQVRNNHEWGNHCISDPATATLIDNGAVKNSKQNVWSNALVTISYAQDLSGTGAADLPMFLVLGHELIHADRAMKGVAYDGTETAQYVDSNNVWRTAKIEELMVCGFWNVHPQSKAPKQVITENSLRKENGVKCESVLLNTKRQ